MKSSNISTLKHKLSKLLTTKFGFILLGVTSTIWFLIRVIPKPQRATYPCMQASAPFMSGLVVYLISLFGSIGSYWQLKRNYLSFKYLKAGFYLLSSIVLFVVFLAQHNLSTYANETTAKLTAPVGEGRGIFPGRVVWIYDPAATKFDGQTGYWWDDSNTIQAEANRMVKASITTLTAQEKPAAAWDALFRHFNMTKKNKLVGYVKGQKIAIKVNMNNTTGHADSRNINGSPQLIFALLTSLIKEAKVPENCITVFDASRFITDNIYNKCHNQYPEVNFVDNIGGDGRIKTTYVENAIPFTMKNLPFACGLATCAVEADYLINMALLKGHSAQGVTLCAKNWFGVTSIYSDFKKNGGVHGYFSANPTGKDQYMRFVDFMGHKDLGEKTLLFMIDGLYASDFVSGVPSKKWKMKPFNNRWPSSLFVSQDGVAIDAVGRDFLVSEWPQMPDLLYSEKYLVEAAQANEPPSKTFYDPEKDGIKCRSLGVMDSWNNSDQKQYSRNLGKKEGIELSFVDLSKSKSIKISDMQRLKLDTNSAQSILYVMNCDPDAQIQLFDSLGTIIKSEKLARNQFNIGQLARGEYNFSIKDNRMCIVEKFVKN